MLEKELRSIVELHQRTLNEVLIKMSHLTKRDELEEEDLSVMQVLQETEVFLEKQLAKLKQEEVKK